MSLAAVNLAPCLMCKLNLSIGRCVQGKAACIGVVAWQVQTSTGLLDGVRAGKGATVLGLLLKGCEHRGFGT